MHSDNFKMIYILTKAAWNEDVDSDRDTIIQNALCLPKNAMDKGFITKDEYCIMMNKISAWPNEGHSNYCFN